MNKTLVLLSFAALAFSSLTHADDAAISHSLDRLGVHHVDIQPSPVAGLKTVLTDSGVLYVSDDGRHIIQGPMFDVAGNHPVNTTNQLLAKRLNALQNEMIIYKAPQEKHVVTVFTDITCGYCHKLHEQIDEYNKLGITLRYLAFPRQGLNSQAEKDMTSIWCTANRNQAFDKAMQGDAISAATCKTDISKHYTLGVQYGIQGTPAMLLEDGTLIPGYQSPKELSAILAQQATGDVTGD